MKKVSGTDFYGIFYPTARKNKAVIIITGSDGGIKWAQKIAELFSAKEVTALAVAYWGIKGTPKKLSLIPIETIQSAVNWLKEQGYTKVGIYGVSKGAELALTSASLIPQIEFVIAVSPACCVFEGIAKPHYSGTSSWTWKGAPLLYASFKNISVNMIKNIFINHEFGFVKQYLKVLATEKNEENTIKVERINGPILLLSAKEDAQWPSAKMGNMVCDRLKEKKFNFPYHHEIFHPASHVLNPVASGKVRKLLKMAYIMERKYKKECEIARKKALQMSIDWIDKV